MILVDVNVLVYAHRADAPDHVAYRHWLEDIINSDRDYGMEDLVLSGFLRVVTHPRIFDPPSTLENGLQFVRAVREQPNCKIIYSGPRHWQIFTQLCIEYDIKGNLVPDAYLAALAIETNSEWITTDRDFGRFPQLQWRHPLDK